MPRQMPMMMRAGSAVSSVESQLIRPIQKNSRIVFTSPCGWYMNFQTIATTICDIAMGKKYAKRINENLKVARWISAGRTNKNPAQRRRLQMESPPTQAASHRTKANLSGVAGCLPRAATLRSIASTLPFGQRPADFRAGLIERSLGIFVPQDDALHRPVDRLVDLDDLG